MVLDEKDFLPAETNSIQKTKKLAVRKQAFSVWRILGWTGLMFFLFVALLGSKIAIHPATEQRPILARIKPVVTAVSVDDYYVFLSDIKNVIIYDDERYVPAESVSYNNGFEEIHFVYNGRVYEINNNGNNIKIKCGDVLYSKTQLLWNAEYPLGTDLLGRCFYSRIVRGLQLSILVSLAVSFLTFSMGLLWGTISGSFGGVVDAIMMRTLDVFSVVPQLLVVILISSFVSSSVIGMIFALGSVSWVRVARIIRGATTHHKAKEYYTILADLGASRFWLITRHIIPNMTRLAIQNTITILPSLVMSEASLSFLGLGLKYPNVSLGSLCSSSLEYIYSSPYLTSVPMVVLILLLLSISFIVHGLKEEI